MSYQIIRYYKDGRKSLYLKKVATLEEAKAHCNDPKTSKKGEYFEGYMEL